MKRKLESQLREAEKLTDPVKVRMAVVGLIRIALQHACVALSEWVIDIASRNTGERARLFFFLPVERLRQPSDGTLVSCLPELLVAAEQIGWNGITKCFFAPIDPCRPAQKLSPSKEPTLELLLNRFVQIRNDGVEGHGLPGDFDPHAELDLAALCIDFLAPLLPKRKSSGELELEAPNGKKLKLSLLRCFNGDMVCYRKIQRLSAGRCRVKVQVQRSLFSREELVYETNDVFSSYDQQDFVGYQIVATAYDDWKPLVLMPDRVTEHFKGRESEISEISDWADDTESRACMLFGDGGIGKTTLAIEFIHRLLDGQLKVTWKPELITFYTAKLTRWGLNGLEVVRTREVGVLDTVVTIVRGFESKPLGREWFDAPPRDLIQKLTSYLLEYGISRSSHLLVLDNTETMAADEEDARALAVQIQELSRRVGRVLVTSRRREQIEARPIEINPLSAEESVAFLKSRGKDLNRLPVAQASPGTLRQYAKKLGNKPLVLEVFLQALGEQGISLERAFDRVARMQQQDLGQFLYADAWGRLSNDVRHLMLLMTRIMENHDEISFKLCCSQCKVALEEASNAIEESRGIATISRLNGQLQITFNAEFIKFCKDRLVQLEDGLKHPSPESVETAKRRYTEFLRSSTMQIRDRVSRAYRHPLAKAAFMAYHDDRYKDCELFYEEATLVDPENGWLYDRYAYFLFKRGRSDALEKALKATTLIPHDAEAWFTRGMIESRIPRTAPTALMTLEKARSLGKAAHLCWLQKAYAYQNLTPADKANARACLDKADQEVSGNDPYYWKHASEARRLRQRLA